MSIAATKYNCHRTGSAQVSMISAGWWAGETKPSSKSCLADLEARLGENAEQFLANGSRPHWADVSTPGLGLDLPDNKMGRAWMGTTSSASSTCLSEVLQLTRTFYTQSFPRLHSVQLMRFQITKSQPHFSPTSLRLFPGHTDGIFSFTHLQNISQSTASNSRSHPCRLLGWT